MSGQPNDDQKDKKTITGLTVAVVILSLIVVGFIAWMIFGKKHIQPHIDQATKKITNKASQVMSPVTQKWQDVTGVTAARQQAAALQQRLQEARETSMGELSGLQAARQQEVAQLQKQLEAAQQQRALDAQRLEQLQYRVSQQQAATPAGMRQAEAAQAAQAQAAVSQAQAAAEAAQANLAAAQAAAPPASSGWWPFRR